MDGKPLTPSFFTRMGKRPVIGEALKNEHLNFR
jgi:hypothetical protein